MRRETCGVKVMCWLCLYVETEEVEAREGGHMVVDACGEDTYPPACLLSTLGASI